MQVELHAQFIPESDILLVVIEDAGEAKLFARCNSVAYSIPKMLEFEKNYFTDYTMTYYSDGLALCTWGRDVDLDNSEYLKLISKYAFANYTKWLKIQAFIGNE